jgi:hypothetical protein
LVSNSWFSCSYYFLFRSNHCNAIYSTLNFILILEKECFIFYFFSFSFPVWNRRTAGPRSPTGGAVCPVRAVKFIFSEKMIYFFSKNSPEGSALRAASFGG